MISIYVFLKIMTLILVSSMGTNHTAQEPTHTSFVEGYVTEIRDNRYVFSISNQERPVIWLSMLEGNVPDWLEIGQFVRVEVWYALTQSGTPSGQVIRVERLN